MKINEIINTQTVTTKLPYKYSTDTMRMRRDQQRPDDDTSGAYAKGTQTRDPHVFGKKSYLPSILENDAYYHYIRVASKYADNNPFFPRVYKIDIRKDRTGKARPSYHMEKLVPWTELNDLNLIAIGNHIFEDFEESVMKYWDDDDVMTIAEQDLMMYIVHVLRKLVDETDRVSSRLVIPKVRDEKLLQAISVTKYVLQSNPAFKVDIHANNIMFRGSPYGYQLVITDPLQDGGKSIYGEKPW